MKYTLFALLIFLVMISVSCDKDKAPLEPQCSSVEIVSYNSVIKPLIQEKCLSCHDLGGGSGGYVFNGHDNVSMSASDMLDAMRANGLQLMPENGPALNDSIIELFECWIYQGKLNN